MAPRSPSLALAEASARLQNHRSAAPVRVIDLSATSLERARTSKKSVPRSDFLNFSPRRSVWLLEVRAWLRPKLEPGFKLALWMVWQFLLPFSILCKKCSKSVPEMDRNVGATLQLVAPFVPTLADLESSASKPGRGLPRPAALARTLAVHQGTSYGHVQQLISIFLGILLDFCIF